MRAGTTAQTAGQESSLALPRPSRLFVALSILVFAILRFAAGPAAALFIAAVYFVFFGLAIAALLLAAVVLG